MQVLFAISWGWDAQEPLPTKGRSLVLGAVPSGSTTSFVEELRRSWCTARLRFHLIVAMTTTQECPALVSGKNEVWSGSVAATLYSKRSYRRPL